MVKFCNILDLGGPIRSVSCADPHLSLVSESGQAAVLTLKEGTLSIVKTKIGIMIDNDNDDNNDNTDNTDNLSLIHI